MVDIVEEVIKEAAKYGMVLRIKPSINEGVDFVVVMMCKPPETQCCVAVSVSKLEIDGIDALELIKNRVGRAANSVDLLLSREYETEWRQNGVRQQKWLKSSQLGKGFLEGKDKVIATDNEWFGTNWFRDSDDAEPYPEIPEYVKEGMKYLARPVAQTDGKLYVS